VTLLVNAKAYETLPKAYREAMRIAATDAHTRMLAKYDARNPEALRRLIAEGAKIQRMPKEVMDAAFKASREVFAEFEAKNEDFRRLNAHYQKFLRDEYAWFRLSELSYDQYMAAAPL
jgi:TRAP-type mannitol/chloroaromatic compound transport system substrate-binding protein